MLAAAQRLTRKLTRLRHWPRTRQIIRSNQSGSILPEARRGPDVELKRRRIAAIFRREIESPPTAEDHWTPAAVPSQPAEKGLASDTRWSRIRHERLLQHIERGGGSMTPRLTDRRGTFAGCQWYDEQLACAGRRSSRRRTRARRGGRREMAASLDERAVGMARPRWLARLRCAGRRDQITQLRKRSSPHNRVLASFVDGLLLPGRSWPTGSRGADRRANLNFFPDGRRPGVPGAIFIRRRAKDIPVHAAPRAYAAWLVPPCQPHLVDPGSDQKVN